MKTLKQLNIEMHSFIIMYTDLIFESNL